MTVKRIAIALIAVVAAAAVAVFLLRRGDDRPVAETRADQPAEPGFRGGRERPGLRGGDGDRGPRALDALMDDDPAGTLRLEGQVVDAGDRGIAGATVVVDTNPPRTATTEQDGSFHFEKLVGRPYRLSARGPAGAGSGQVAGPVVARLSADSEPVILRLRAGGSAVVTAIDAASRDPIAGATVELRGLDTLTATTGEDGVATLAGVVPGGYRLVARAPGYAVEHGWLRVTGPTPRTATLALRRGAAVAGTVRDPDGNPIAGARVLYAGASSWGRQADPRRDAAITDAAGAFRFEALPAGTFRFTARHEEHAPGSSEMVTLDGAGERTGVAITLTAGAVLRGRVVSAGGETVGSARVRLVPSGRGFVRDRPRQAYTDDDGRFEVRALPRKPIDVVALHESAASETRTVDLSAPPHEREVELVLDMSESIAGSVVDSAGEPVEGAQVSAMPDFRRGAEFAVGDWQLRGIAQELTDAGGLFEIRGLREGPYMLRASPPGAGIERRDEWVREPTEAAAGDRDVRIVLDPDGAITGKLAFRDGTAPDLFTVSVGGFGGTPVASKDGAFTLEDLPPREYTVTFRGVGFDTRQVPSVVVEPGKTVDIGTIAVRKGRVVAGRVTAGDQPVEGATVRAGQQIFGDGGSTKATAGGPPFARTAKETTTDADGQFTLTGVVPSNMAIVAEHDQLGRSRAQLIPGSRDSVYGLLLALEPFGALEGRVTVGGEPVANVIVHAQPTAAPGASFGVSTGEDGAFRFDRLAPDEYKLSAMVGMPMRGMSFHSRTVTVESNETAVADLTVESGGVSLSIALAPTNAERSRFAFVHAIRGQVTASTSAELSLKLASLGTGFSSFAISIFGRPATIAELTPGDYSVCAVPLPAELTDRQDIGAYMEREADRLPVFCVPHRVTEAPAEQTVTVQVTLPAYVPDPDGESPEGGGASGGDTGGAGPGGAGPGDGGRQPLGDRATARPSDRAK